MTSNITRYSCAHGETIENIKIGESLGFNDSCIHCLRERIEELKELFEEGFNSGEAHDLDEWEIRAKKYLASL